MVISAIITQSIRAYTVSAVDDGGYSFGGSIMICQKCGTQSLDDAAFCHKCGNALVGEVGYCHKCGEELSPNFKFCRRCGEPKRTSRVESKHTSQ